MEQICELKRHAPDTEEGLALLRQGFPRVTAPDGSSYVEVRCVRWQERPSLIAQTLQSLTVDQKRVFKTVSLRNNEVEFVVWRSELEALVRQLGSLTLLDLTRTGVRGEAFGAWLVEHLKRCPRLSVRLSCMTVQLDALWYASLPAAVKARIKVTAK